MKLISFTLFLLIALNSFTNSGSRFSAGQSDEQESKQVAEKVYLQMDRSSYTSGDDIWFKAYIIDPSTNRLSYNTINLHVELIAPDSKIILSRIIRIERGIGKGDFQLNESYPSGRYRIRAYTNFMRNYEESFFFQREITVLNPYDDAKVLNPPVLKIENKIDFTFFPEGGSLVDNVTSALAYKAVNSLGRGCDVTIKLFSSTGELITAFNSAHRGMGYFKIMPLPGHEYYTIVQSKDGPEIKVPLPKSFPTGVAIHTVLTPDKKLMLTVNTNDVTLPSLINQDHTVSISSRNLVNKTTKIRINSLVNNFLMPLDSMPDGIIRVTLSSSAGLPLCERLFFLQKNSDIRLNISTDKNIYKPREKVSAELSVSDGSAFKGGDFSFSAAEQRFTNDSSLYPTSIASWFLLESDVRGEVEEPSYYFDPDNKNRFMDIDLLLLTQGWRDFKWKYDSSSAFEHEIGFMVSGQMKKGVYSKPVEGVKLNLSLFSSGSTQLFDALTDKEGTFRFKKLNINGNVKAYITSSGKSENLKAHLSVAPVMYEPPAIEKLSAFSIELAPVKNNYITYQQEAITKINNLKKYKLKDTLDLGEVIVTAERNRTTQEIKVKESRIVYNIPDKELKITPAAENYGGDVLAYISGRIPGVRVVRGVDPCSIYFPHDAEVYIREQFTVDQRRCMTDPKKKPVEIRRGALILVDGLEVTPENLMDVLSLPVKMVDRVDVLNTSPLYGMRGANGVINIITRTSGSRRDPVEISANTIIVTIKGFDIPRIFYSPKYNNPADKNNIPDYRSTIFWDPDIKVERNKLAKVEFYNADNPATIKMTIEGVTEEGVPLSTTLKYTVK